VNEISRAGGALLVTPRLPPLRLLADQGWMHRFRLAAEDLKAGANLWRLSWALGVADIQLRYRGSVLGPFWLTLSTAIMIGAMAFLYADLFHTEIHTYLPYLTISLIFWNYLNTIISEGCACFTQAEGTIRGFRMPFTVHAARNVVRNTIVLAHNLVVVVAVFVIMGTPVGWSALWAIPAFLLWLVDGFAISLLLGAFCARFRDVPQIIMSLMQIAFFVTPVMWYAKLLQGHGAADLLIRFNPFFYILEILRGPVLGTAVTAGMVGNALLVSGVVIGLAAIGFARARGRLAYWV
jgi:homopolymeric O-antigen transport system permease protein